MASSPEEELLSENESHAATNSSATSDERVAPPPQPRKESTRHLHYLQTSTDLLQLYNFESPKDSRHWQSLIELGDDPVPRLQLAEKEDTLVAMEKIDSLFRKLRETVIVILEAMRTMHGINEKVMVREKDDDDWTFDDLYFCWDSACEMLDVLEKAQMDAGELLCSNPKD